MGAADWNRASAAARPWLAARNLVGAREIGPSGHGSAQDLYGKKEEDKGISPQMKMKAEMSRGWRATGNGGRRWSANDDGAT